MEPQGLPHSRILGGGPSTRARFRYFGKECRQAPGRLGQGSVLNKPTSAKIRPAAPGTTPFLRVRAPRPRSRAGRRCGGRGRCGQRGAEVYSGPARRASTSGTHAPPRASAGRPRNRPRAAQASHTDRAPGLRRAYAPAAASARRRDVSPPPLRYERGPRGRKG